MTTPFTSSNYGDRHLFFQHSYMETDLAIHPEWKNQTDIILEEQAAINNYYYPDLPFN